MKIFGFDVSVKKSASNLRTVPGAGGWFPLVSESYAGAWQQGVTVTRDDMLAHSAVHACISLISSDIGKMPIRVTQQAGGIWTPTASPYDALLRKPNDYQNRAQFFSQWITSLLIHGNTYALKRRGPVGTIEALYILDPAKVQPLIADDGSVFYRVTTADQLQGIPAQGVTIPAREVIHDRMMTPHHPLIGVSPLTACALAAGQGVSIQKNSAALFANASNPGGLLTTDGSLSPEQVADMKAQWAQNYGGANSGKVAVLAAGLKFQQLSITPADAQLLEQLKFTAEAVCTAFHVPAYKIGAGAIPTYGNAEVLNQIYYTDCVQSLIESLELCLDAGLDLPPTQRTEFDVEALLRMDTVTRYQAYSAAIGGGWMAPNEARRKEGLPPVEGGDSVYLQQQNYSLAALAKRDQTEGVPA